MIRTKSVRSPIDRKTDGLRILATRYRGRRLSARRYDVWMASLGPSEPLLHAFQKKKIQWETFRRRYRKELFQGGSMDRRNRSVKNRGQKFTLRLLQELARRGPVTLMCHCKEEEKHCHRHLLQKVLKGKV